MHHFLSLHILCPRISVLSFVFHMTTVLIFASFLLSHFSALSSLSKIFIFTPYVPLHQSPLEVTGTHQCHISGLCFPPCSRAFWWCMSYGVHAASLLSVKSAGLTKTELHSTKTEWKGSGASVLTTAVKASRAPTMNPGTRV